MKRRLTSAAAILGSAILFAPLAQADNSYSRSGYSYDNYHRVAAVKVQREPVRLKVKYRLNGDGSVPLRRLIQNEYNIDTRDYDLQRVSIRSKQRRDACVDLHVGHRTSGVRNLREGVTRIDAPRARGNAPWTLHFADARVREINVLLVPKQNVAYSDRGFKRDRGYNSGYAFGGNGYSRRNRAW